MKILNILERSKDFWFLISVSFFFFLLRLPSLFEPYWYGDEGIYQVLGMGINQGKLLYSGIWDNKPPLLYLLYAFFSSDQFTIRLVSMIFGVFSVLVFFALSKKLFEKNSFAFFTTSIFAILFGLPFLEGNIANSENFMIFPTLLSGLILFKLITDKKNENKRLSFFNFSCEARYSFAIQLFLAGLILSFSFLFKIVAVFDFAAFIVFLFIVNSLKVPKLLKSIEDLFFFLAGFALPIIITILFFVFNNAFSDFTKAAFFQNVGYVSYGNKFLIPQGFLLLKLFFLFLFVLFVFIKRKSLSTSSIFILIWLAFSIFNAFFSQRPYTHYLLVLLPGFCLFLGLLLQDKKLQKIYAVFLILLIFLLSQNFTVYGKTNRYYQNFISFVKGSKSVYEYRKFFDRNTPNDYYLAEFIKMHTTQNDNIFIWGNNAQVYKLTNKLPPGRFTVAYHITAKPEYLNETLNDLRRAVPKYIIVTSRNNFIPFPLTGYTHKANINNSIIYERTF
ncbi:MAG: hypothetical protein Q7K55_04290 [Candidatus Levybacteria bacterium]|nr:hypothetical protein [Candidatus Levybacteria bacterium]